MCAFDPVEPARTKARAKPRTVKKLVTMAERLAGFTGSDTFDTWPPDTSRRYIDYLRASLVEKPSR